MSTRVLFVAFALQIVFLVLPPGPAPASEATPEALVRFEGFGAGLREAVADHTRVRLVDLPAADGSRLDLELRRIQVLTPGARIYLGHEEVKDAPDVAVLRGKVRGEPESEVLLSLSENHSYGILDRPGRESLVIAPTEAVVGRTGERYHEVIPSADVEVSPDLDIDPLTGAPMPRCLVEPELIPRPTEQEMKDAVHKATTRICRIAMECDYEFWENFLDLGDALANIYLITAAVSVMYERDIDVRIVLPWIRIWSIPGDPYSYVGGASTGLDEFRNYWVTNHNPGQPGFVERDLAHLRSGRGVGAYGWVGKLCDYNQGYSISGGEGGTTAVGILHDISFVGHEIGHNLNGNHTHCFDPPVDQCATAAGCNQTQDCSTAPGTIMSYCHSCPGGYSNILQQVSPENQARMLSHVSTSCIPTSCDPCYVDLNNGTGVEDGSSAYPFDTVEEGTLFVAPGGEVRIVTGGYAEILDVWQSMTLSASSGDAVIGQ